MVEAAVNIGKQFSTKVSNPMFGGKVYQYLKREMYADTIKILKDTNIGFVEDFVAEVKSNKSKM